MNEYTFLLLFLIVLFSYHLLSTDSFCFCYCLKIQLQIVLDTNAERLAIVGWYNKKLSASDIKDLGVDIKQLGLLAVAAALITVGLVSLISQ